MTLPGRLLLSAAVGWVDFLSSRVSAWALAVALAALIAVVAVWAPRARRLATNPRSMRRLYRLGEQLMSGGTAGAKLDLLRRTLPELLGITGVDVYLYNRFARSFAPVSEESPDRPRAMPILADDPVGFREKCIAACFRNRSLIAIPDTTRSPFYRNGEAAPRAAMFVPMFAHEDLLGVLEISNERRGRAYTDDEQAVSQHLANQMAVGMRLLEQKSLRERAAGAARPGAFCPLLELSARELNEPLEAMAAALRDLWENPGGQSSEARIERVGAEIRRAEAIVSRVVQLASAAQNVEAGSDLALVVRRALDEHGPRWKQLGIYTEASVPGEGLPVAEAQHSYLVEIVLSLFRHIEEHLAGVRESSVRVTLSRLAGKAQLDLAWASTRPAEEDGPRLDACRAALHAWGGDLRMVSGPGGHRLEVMLPLPAEEVREPADIRHPAEPCATQLTALIVRPGLSEPQCLLRSLDELGHRGVCVAGVEEAVEFVKKLRFHVLFCSQHLPDPPWVECFEKTRSHVGAFILVTHGYDAALSAALPPGEALALPEPVRPDELRRMLGELSSRFDGPAK